MQKIQNQIVYSASDLVNFLECEHLTSLDLRNLNEELAKTEDSDEAKLIQAKGIEHEKRYLAKLKDTYQTVIEIEGKGSDKIPDKVAATIKAMQQGADVIYQATLLNNKLIGHADFLLKRPGKSIFGDYFYEVADTKLARSGKAKFVVQLGFYSLLLAEVQAAEPQQMIVVLGEMNEATYRYTDYSKYIQHLIERLFDQVADQQHSTYPDPCPKCDECRWLDRCKTQRKEDDHLCAVANITKIQIKKLKANGISTVKALAEMPIGTTVPKIDPRTLIRLQKQASLQYRGRSSATTLFELIPHDGDDTRAFGFARLPRPSPGDLFFDMEGNPLEQGGLEYLFGIYYFPNGEGTFVPFWAHNRAEEKISFEKFMDFVVQHLSKHPDAHIYHYAPYEETALKRLMTQHGTKEFELDTLLRQRKFVDLYKVVREGIRISEESYSIKSVEKLYMAKRATEVTQGGASIVYYERWKETGEQKLLDAIAEYNEDDVKSTFLLREWLIANRSPELPWWKADSDNLPTDVDSAPQNAYEQRISNYREQLVNDLPPDDNDRTEDQRFRELTFQLLDFHRRAQKPLWWEKFRREDMKPYELLEDPETLAELRIEPGFPQKVNTGSHLYKYRFPEQDTKLKSGDRAIIQFDDLEVEELEIDEETLIASFTLKEHHHLPLVNLVPGAPLPSRPLPDSVARFADSIVNNSNDYPAIESILRRSYPKINGIQEGNPLIPKGNASISEITKVVKNMGNTHLFIQGPPGTGKTFTASHVIVELLKDKNLRIGISSNSHKAIHNLLEEVDKVANKAGVTFKGAKKVSAGNEDSYYTSPNFSNQTSADQIAKSLGAKANIQLIAGTAWLFASKALVQTLDYLFIDEAGQVALANLVAMGVSTKNIVLMGDQMQLGQPVQGSHPGRSGDSTLDYLLDGIATIPAERGIFLETTYRMHPDISDFISEAVYDGRLKSDESTKKQRLFLSSKAHTSLKPTGIRFLPLDHNSCSQRSHEEAALILEIFQNLLGQKWINNKSEEHPLCLEDILVVAPYNQQVNLLKHKLPTGARVGTVDKFQGQEAQVVIMSMTTSSGEELPRHIEFLFSKNRINVALSRAKCFSIFIFNPKLLSIRCASPEQMALVNVLCWLREFE